METMIEKPRSKRRWWVIALVKTIPTFDDRNPCKPTL